MKEARCLRSDKQTAPRLKPAHRGLFCFPNHENHLKDHGEAPNFNANSPTCGPGSVPSVSILHVLINGDWMKADDVFPDVVLARWTESLTVEQIERAQDAAEAAMEDAADAARDDIRNYGRYAIKAAA